MSTVESSSFDPNVTGVDYSPEEGAGRCLRCHTWVKGYKTFRFVEGVRIRYHTCPECSFRFKSSEKDPTYRRYSCR